jgi:hypothetical protein
MCTYSHTLDIYPNSKSWDKVLKNQVIQGTRVLIIMRSPTFSSLECMIVRARVFCVMEHGHLDFILHVNASVWQL